MRIETGWEVVFLERKTFRMDHDHETAEAAGRAARQILNTRFPGATLLGVGRVGGTPVMPPTGTQETAA